MRLRYPVQGSYEYCGLSMMATVDLADTLAREKMVICVHKTPSILKKIKDCYSILSYYVKIILLDLICFQRFIVRTYLQRVELLQVFALEYL